MNRTTIIILASLGVLVALYLLSRKGAPAASQVVYVPEPQQQAPQGQYPGSPFSYALGAGTSATKAATSAAFKPITNITSGNVSGTAKSILTGGLSDLW